MGPRRGTTEVGGRGDIEGAGKQVLRPNTTLGTVPRELGIDSSELQESSWWGRLLGCR